MDSSRSTDQTDDTPTGFTIAPETNRLTIEDARHVGASIKVVGVGGGGSNAVDRMVRTGCRGIEYIVANTDAQALGNSVTPVRLQIGCKLTNGLGAGADPIVGRQAALEDTEQIIAALDGADMVFVTTGLGGGTGTGAAPVIANLASELGALTVAVVTTPFKFEGRRRAAQAEHGLAELRECVDTVITIPNERLLSVIARSTTLPDAFAAADDILRQAIQGISDLILVPGLINLDFADVTAVMSRMGVAIMGTGVGTGENRTVDAATQAISSPLIENASVEGARGVIINVTGGADLSLLEINEATSIIQSAAHEDANIIFGAVVDPTMDEEVKVTVIATGFDREGAERPAEKTPIDLQQYHASWQQEEPRAEAAGGGGFLMSRRQPIHLPQPASTAAHEAKPALFDSESIGSESIGSESVDASEVDVPAFLRRQDTGD